ncbi:MAG: hypothetical protein K0Q95_20 [Bacteroidota bacterium]|jgi:hypothetical protein|nr:hypothetical protein [Bacteroidota bacterium]
MKNSVKIFVTAVLIGSAGLQSCTKEKQQEIAYKLAENYINEGKWKVSSFKEDDKDETGHFDGYVFVFNTDNTVTATKGNSTVKGTWSTGTDNSKTKMNINFSSAPLDELSEDWIIVNGSKSSIELKHVSGGDGGTDYLTFQKI